eukprot:TRINITY_DN3563_c0_g1_i1.p1 TRINITY_DN3563_c0_g1~~TRINITY_DN3563_c0_g1_i1.p1  ORF type:complete len:1134 (+),score=240.94 TRINITY_DN3563_c0_g1_i1:1659-5060(+)
MVLFIRRSILCYDDEVCLAKFDGYCAPYPGRAPAAWNAPLPSITNGAKYNRICVRLCETDSDCTYGTCVQLNGWKECRHTAATDPFINKNWTTAFATCVAQEVMKTKPIFQISFLNILNITVQNPPLSQLRDLILSSTINTDPTIPSCSAPVYPGTPNTDACLSGQTCNYFRCDTQDPLGQDASICQRSCNFTMLSTDFCGLVDTPLVKQDITQSGTCVIMPTYGNYGQLTNSLPLCESNYGGNFWESFRLCLKSAPLESNCFKTPYCANKIPWEDMRHINWRMGPFSPAKGTVCLPRCHLANAKTAPICQSIGGTWASEGFCEVPALTHELCLAYRSTTVTLTQADIDSLTWWPGAYYLPPQYDTSGSCQSFCLTDSSLTTRADCEAPSSRCSNPYCVNCDIDTCPQSGECTAIAGCYFKLTSTGQCDTSFILSKFTDYNRREPLEDYIDWTPEGCVVKFTNGFFINQLTCTSMGGLYRSHSEWRNLTNATCSNLAKICKLPTNSTLNYATTTRKASDIWEGYAFKTGATNCAACGGKWVSAYDWIPGKMITAPGRWMEVSWQPRAMIPAYETVDIITREKFLDVFNRVDIDYEATVIRTRLRCRYDGLRSVIPAFSCVCNANVTNTTDTTPCGCSSSNNNNFNDAFFKSATICRGRNTTEVFQEERFSAPRLTVGVDAGNFSITSLNSCIDLKAYAVTVKNFLTATDDTLVVESGRSFNTQFNLRPLAGYLQNDNQIIIGEILDQVGYKLNFSATTAKTGSVVNGVNVCIYVNRDLPTPLPYAAWAYYGIAVLNTSSNSSHPLILYDTKISVNDPNKTICLPFEENANYFLVSLIENQDTTYIQTMNAGDISALYGMMAIYAIAMVIVILMLILDIRRFKMKFTKFIKVTAFFLLPAFALRIANCAWLLSDPSDELISVIYIELPSMLIWFIGCLNLARWLQPKKREEDVCSCANCCLPKLKPFVWVLIATISILFIAYLAVVVGRVSSAETDPRRVVNVQQLLLSYIFFSVLLTFCIIAIIWFLFALILGACGSCEIIFGNDMKELKIEKFGIFFSLLAAIAVLAGQTIILARVFLWQELDGSALSDWSVTTWVIALMIVDVVPGIIVLITSAFSPLNTASLIGDNDEDL